MGRTASPGKNAYVICSEGPLPGLVGHPYPGKKLCGSMQDDPPPCATKSGITDDLIFDEAIDESRYSNSQNA